MLCRSCYAEIPAGSAFCPRCGARQGDVAPEAAAAPPAPPAETPPDNPWELRGGRGVVEAFGETLQRSLFHPARFFRGTSPQGSAGPALGYGAIVGSIGLLVMGLWQLALGTFTGAEGSWFGVGSGRVLPLVFLPLLPLWVTFSNIVAAAVLHVSLTLLGGARGGYGATLKAVSYATSAMAFYAIPGVGVVVGMLWQIAISVIGLRELHRTCCTARALLAYALPLLVGLALLVVAGIVAALAGIGAFMHLLERGVQV